MIFNQFDEFGNYLWHYVLTGKALEEVLEKTMGPKDEYRGMVSATGSGGTIGSGDYMKQKFPGTIVAASEALQCPTLLFNGFGSHRIEGIGDKHVPWIHNVKSTDMILAIDDEAVVSLARLFNEPAGHAYLAKLGVPKDFIAKLDLMGFSGIANVLSAIKMAKYYEMGEHDIILTILTDSMELYTSRLGEMRQEYGEYAENQAAADFARYLRGVTTDNMLELAYTDRKRVHNLKYYTWIEQQGKTYPEIQAQWYDPNYWTELQSQVGEIDELIKAFNADVGIMK
jgi:cysteine synthase A